MSGSKLMEHRALFSVAPRRHRFKIRAAVEAMEDRVMLSTYFVNTFVDQTDAPSSKIVSLRDAIAEASGDAGPDTIDVPAGDYKLTQGGLFCRPRHQ